MQAASEEDINNFCYFVYLSHQYFQNVQISTMLLETCKKVILYVQSSQLQITAQRMSLDLQVRVPLIYQYTPQ